MTTSFRYSCDGSSKKEIAVSTSFAFPPTASRYRLLPTFNCELNFYLKMLTARPKVRHSESSV